MLQVTVHMQTPHRGEREKVFSFDSVFGFDAKQVDIYNETARPIVNSVLDGYNGDCSTSTHTPLFLFV